MSEISTIESSLRDFYAPPGTRLKQYVVDMNRENAWERETCPRVDVPAHDDNTGAPCWNSGRPAPWRDLDHPHCRVCGDHYQEVAARDDIVAWQAVKASRPPICADRDKLSDEVAPDLSLRESPVFALLRRPR